MEVIILIFVIFYIVSKQSSKGKMQKVNLGLIVKLLRKKKFSNIRIEDQSANFTMLGADNLGENFLYLIKNNSKTINKNDIENIYDHFLSKIHVHNVIVVLKSLNNNEITNEAKEKAREYKMDVIGEAELIKKLNEEEATILKTSDTSDDTCEIDYSQNDDPINDNPSGLSKWFKGPDRL